MTTTTDPRLNGHHASPATARTDARGVGGPAGARLTPEARRSGRRWICFPVGLIVGQIGIVGTMMYVATSDPSFAVEPDYYEKALAWDSTAQQHAANQRLAWRTTVRVAPAAGGGSELVVLLTNSDGTALDGAKIAAEVFASTRARERSALALEARGNGVYAAPASITRAGLWECRLVVDRGPERFTATARLEVRAQGGAGE